ncbi:MAG: ABC transporter permease [Flavobacteriales bacterium]|nr:ABC transporter permease [Flavobacteriales bacterium]MDW8410254.1 ABC transporter permease [Flavobacteriales bacterium]
MSRRVCVKSDPRFFLFRYPRLETLKPLFRHLSFFIAALRLQGLLVLTDLGALLMLFVLPLAMVCIITLIQKGAFDAMHQPFTSLAVVDCDKDSLGLSIVRGLQKASSFQLEILPDSTCTKFFKFKEGLQKDQWQAGLHIPKGATLLLRKAAERRARALLMGSDTDTAVRDFQTEVEVYFSPSLQPPLNTLLFLSLERLVQSAATSLMIKELGFHMGPSVQQALSHEVEELGPVHLKEKSLKDGSPTRPDAATHNIPAWTVFAMFFIVVPMATGIVRERDLGLRNRQRMLPHPLWIHELARIFIYILICFGQALLIFSAGWLLFPVLGLGRLPSQMHFALLPVCLAVTAFAATAFGNAVGLLARTHEQAAAFGSLIVVILAALGGLWVPHFVMPPALQKVASWSPLHWALESFYTVILFRPLSPEGIGHLLKLLAFGLACLTLTACSFRFGGRKNSSHSATE